MKIYWILFDFSVDFSKPTLSHVRSKNNFYWVLKNNFDEFFFKFWTPLKRRTQIHLATNDERLLILLYVWEIIWTRKDQLFLRVKPPTLEEFFYNCSMFNEIFIKVFPVVLNFLRNNPRMSSSGSFWISVNDSFKSNSEVFD